MDRYPPMPEFPTVPILAMLVALLVGLVVLALTLFLWWRIVSKTGHSGLLALLVLLPFGNLILMLLLALGRWPIEDRLRQDRLSLDDPIERDEIGPRL